MAHVILVVEDEEELREILKDSLVLSGFDVEVAGDGRAALDVLARVEHVCLVLLDLVMPVMNGWDFLLELRTNAAFDAIPVVVTTSAPESAPQGTAGVLPKPLQLDRVLQTVRTHCRQI